MPFFKRLWAWAPWHHLRKRFVRYLAMSGLSFMISVGLTVSLHEVLGVPEESAAAVALATAFVVNFVTVRQFVFRNTNDPFPQMVRFGLTSIVFRIVEYLFFLLLHSHLGVFYVVALIVTLVTSLVLKYLCYRYFVFGPRRGEDAKALAADGFRSDYLQ